MTRTWYGILLLFGTLVVAGYCATLAMSEAGLVLQSWLGTALVFAAVLLVFGLQAFLGFERRAEPVFRESTPALSGNRVLYSVEPRMRALRAAARYGWEVTLEWEDEDGMSWRHRMTVERLHLPRGTDAHSVVLMFRAGVDHAVPLAYIRSVIVHAYSEDAAFKYTIRRDPPEPKQKDELHFPLQVANKEDPSAITALARGESARVA